MRGVIEATDAETHQIITAEFHDKSLNRGYHFNDTFRYSMAALGPRGALYACGPEKGGRTIAGGTGEGENITSASLGQVHYRPYETWASSAEWSLSLNKGEVPIAVCAGGAPLSKSSSRDPNADEHEVAMEFDADCQPIITSEEAWREKEFRRGPKDAGGAGYAIVALNTGDVHFWLGTGIHLYTWRLGGEVVCMDAGAEWVFVVHREGGTSLDGECLVQFAPLS